MTTTSIPLAQIGIGMSLTTNDTPKDYSENMSEGNQQKGQGGILKFREVAAQSRPEV
jgi:hypothetical protein